ncbi:hypothetical protein RCL_jg4177.t1 [Rhizophagus clarus]|uniref:Uncharacterized protein n=1 Tax=Rhizophagus clarus TaxID=94130 RepID=A0A8H3KVK5_9GLOM|nr:hypothetical protein RCL_jg4177.t1 [Rhizophagus clarus]
MLIEYQCFFSQKCHHVAIIANLSLLLEVLQGMVNSTAEVIWTESYLSKHLVIYLIWHANPDHLSRIQPYIYLLYFPHHHDLVCIMGMMYHWIDHRLRYRQYICNQHLTTTEIFLLEICEIIIICLSWSNLRCRWCIYFRQFFSRTGCLRNFEHMTSFWRQLFQRYTIIYDLLKLCITL